MRCPRCGSERIGERLERTAQDYRRFRCWPCGKQFNEHSGTTLNRNTRPTSSPSWWTDITVSVAPRPALPGVAGGLHYRLAAILLFLASSATRQAVISSAG